MSHHRNRQRQRHRHVHRHQYCSSLLGESDRFFILDRFDRTRKLLLSSSVNAIENYYVL